MSASEVEVLKAPPRRKTWNLFGLDVSILIATCAYALHLLHFGGAAGDPGAIFWMLIVVQWIGATILVNRLAHAPLRSKAARRARDLAVPLAFGAFLFYLWEVLVIGFGVRPVLMPAPSAIVGRFAAALPLLLQDATQTVLRSALPGYAIGCFTGFATAILIDRVPFLKRGLPPVANLASALPIVGIAPIMVMWFGFDWPSKAAVAALMTFFPMLVNAAAGLDAAGRSERDLMRSYGAGYWATLLKLRLPAALPFLFTALKINATLALIGAIVAEFFGTPIVGMGFRISTEAAKLALDMVWAEIAMAALVGSGWYGLIALAERSTAWRP